jgi:peptidoglycan/xylan/chitin deacetylase (PgdA/CDA1 family)
MPGRQISRRLAVLGFHKIGQAPPGRSSTWFYISEKLFEGYLRCLQEKSWQVIDADTFLRGLDHPERLPERAALLTFDDGYRSMRQTALPVLKSLGLPSVVFVSAGHIGSTNRFDADVEPEEPICGWDDLEELQHANVSVQSHGVSHRHFSKLDNAQIRYEIEHSKRLVERHMGHAVEMFSFPYGDNGADPSFATAILRNAGYSAAFLYGGNPDTTPPCDRFAIQRIAMGPDTDLAALLNTL